MSRIGKNPIKLPQGVTVKPNGTVIDFQGPKGSLSLETYGRVQVSEKEGNLHFDLSEGEESKYWGLYRTLSNNAVEGVSKGFERRLKLIGTGYRANVTGKTLNLTVGLSHPVAFEAPEGLTFQVEKSGEVVVSGIDKQVVGQMAAKIRAVRPPEPYHGKGIRYVNEVIVTKVGKSAGKK